MFSISSSNQSSYLSSDLFHMCDSVFFMFLFMFYLVCCISHYLVCLVFYFHLLFICRLELFRNMYIFVIITKSLSNDMTHFKHLGIFFCFSNYLTRCVCVSVCVILILLYQLKYTKFGKTLDRNKESSIEKYKILTIVKVFQKFS